MSSLVKQRPVEVAPRRSDFTHLDGYRWFTGSNFIGLFAVALFDQAMHPEVSAALVATGRIRFDSIQRGVRSAASAQIMQWGDTEDREREAARLRDLHRDVRGTTPDGTRYSALRPETWNLIIISTLRMYRNAYIAVTGNDLSPEEHQACYEHDLAMMDRLQLPGSNRLPQAWEDACRWYDELARTSLADTETLRDALRAVKRPGRPEFLPKFTAPLWWVAGPVAGNVLLNLGLGIMHPHVRDLTGMPWGRGQQAEFAVLTRIISTAYAVLPKRVTLSPLAYNRLRYEHTIAAYRSIGLTSFVPDGAQQRTGL